MTGILGTVHLVGAGPGDPGLLTVRAAELIRACDCVVHDYLVSPGILSLIPPQAARHYVGKRGHSTSITQTDINALLVKLAGVHRCIVRLKGGDPFLFGRGGEELADVVEGAPGQDREDRRILGAADVDLAGADLGQGL